MKYSENNRRDWNSAIYANDPQQSIGCPLHTPRSKIEVLPVYCVCLIVFCTNLKEHVCITGFLVIICRIIKRLKSILKYFVFIALHMCQARKFITCTSGTFEQRALSWKSDWNNNNEMLVNEKKWIIAM